MTVPLTPGGWERTPHNSNPNSGIPNYPPPLAQARPRFQKTGQNGGPRQGRACARHTWQQTCGGALTWGWRGAANGEEHFIKSGIVLNLLPIPHVLQMDVVVPMTRGTKNIGRHMFPSAPNAYASHAGNNIVSHG